MYAFRSDRNGVKTETEGKLNEIEWNETEQNENGLLNFIVSRSQTLSLALLLAEKSGYARFLDHFRSTPFCFAGEFSYVRLG